MSPEENRASAAKKLQKWRKGELKTAEREQERKFAKRARLYAALELKEYKFETKYIKRWVESEVRGSYHGLGRMARRFSTTSTDDGKDRATCSAKWCPNAMFRQADGGWARHAFSESNQPRAVS